MKEAFVFIVDDTPDTTELLSAFLKSENFQTQTFASGKEVLVALNHKIYPDLILLDLKLPDITGIKITEHIRANPQFGYIPIILITASTNMQDCILSLEAGVDDFLIKPFNLNELLARVHSLIRHKRLFDEKAHLLLEVQQAYHRLETAHSDLMQAEKQKLQMEAMMTTAASICHEMSQPITTALILLQLVKQADGNAQEDLNTVEINLLQMRIILDKLRALTRYETKSYNGNEHILDLDRSSNNPLLD